MLINLHRILIYLRMNIEDCKNISVIEEIIVCVIELKSNEELLKSLRDKFAYIDQLMCGTGQNVYDKNNISEFIIKMLLMTKNNIEEKKYDLAYDIIDMIHFLPELLIDYDRKQLKRYWKINVYRFSKKWSDEIYKDSKKYFN